MGEVRKLIIIGSGPAGYTAGVYAGRAELKPLLFAGEVNGGQLMNTTVVENWPGFREGVQGPELMMAMREQAAKFGSEIVDKFVTEVDFSKRPFEVRVGEEKYYARAVIVATGAQSIMLGVPGEKEFLGRGVATCAVCDAAFYKDKVTYVVGGGDAAVEDTLALTKYAKLVTMLVRKEELKASKIMARRVQEHEKVTIMWNSELKEVKGQGRVERIVVENNQSGEEKELLADGVFLAVGHKPVTEIFQGKLELDEKGFLITRLGLSAKGVEMAKAHVGEDGLLEYPTTTSVEGIFGAGDVVDFRYKQAVTAAAMGCQAALDAERWLETQEEHV